jgi:hypothetical protein
MICNLCGQFLREVKKHIRCIVLSVLVAIVTLIMLLFLLYWQVSFSLKQNAETRMSLAMSRLELVVSHAEKAAYNVNELSATECNAKVLQALRLQVATIPDVRTINLETGGRVFCSSVYGAMPFQSAIADSIQNMLVIVPGTLLTPDSSALIYRIMSPDKIQRVEVGVDGYYIYNVLSLVSDVTPVYLHTGNTTMTPAGEVMIADYLDARKADYLLYHSSRFPMMVYTPYSLPIHSL